MLKEINFYSVCSMANPEKGIIKAEIKLNGTHDIFKGHFPETPVVPGVCMITMIKEILEEHINRSLLLQNAGNIKFLNLLTPGENPLAEISIKFSLDDEKVEISEAVISSGNITFLKLNKAIYK